MISNTYWKKGLKENSSQKTIIELRMKILFRTISLLVFSLILFSCVKKIKEDPKVITPKISIDLDQIKKKGKLVAITGFNAYSYFIYKGQPMGYEYELLKRLAADLEVELEIKVIHELEEMIVSLNEGGGDLIAFNLTVTKERTKAVSFTEHHTLTPQVLIQRKPDNWREMKLHEIKRKLDRADRPDRFANYLANTTGHRFKREGQI